MSQVRQCVLLFVLLVHHHTASAKPSLWSSLIEMFSESCDSSDLDDMFDDSSDSGDSKSDSSSDTKLFNLTLPPSSSGLSVVVEKVKGQVAVIVNSISDASTPGATTETTTAAATTKTAATTATTPTTKAKA